MFVCFFACLFVCMFACLFACLFVTCLFGCLFVLWGSFGGGGNEFDTINRVSRRVMMLLGGGEVLTSRKT